jgi:hypothetical protein
MSILAVTYQNQGRWNEAEELEVHVLETRKRVQGKDHLHTLISMGNLVMTYQNQCWWKETEELVVHLLETSKGVLGKDHPDTLASMSILAVTYQNQGRWNEAEALEEHVLEARKRIPEVGKVEWRRDVGAGNRDKQEPSWPGAFRDINQDGKPGVDISGSGPGGME